MGGNTALISGTAMMVIAGVVCCVAPWFTEMPLGGKFLFFVFGAALIGGGGYLSKG